RSDDGGTKEASPPRRQRTGGDGSPPSPGARTRTIDPPLLSANPAATPEPEPHRLMADLNSDKRQPNKRENDMTG
ncbi:LOW QUALITY PROTEIN: hypothetical protein HID58_016422, partial [Brassica napus]